MSVYKTTEERVREALDQIDEIFCGLDSYAQEKLMTILTALRGPDNGNSAIKMKTTAIIRAKAFPKLMEAQGEVENTNVGGIERPMVVNGMYFNQYDQKVKINCDDAKPFGYHFYTHVISAARTLGIKDEEEG